jgi:acylphosphatase
MPRDALRFTIRGQVQGVGYRWWAVEQARALGIAGWVRNRADGSVEVLAIGSPDALAAFGWACGRGPGAARVASVDRSPAEDDGSLEFSEKATV